MKKQFIVMLVAVFSTVFSMQAQTELSGVKLNSKLSIEGQNLILNGAGVREKMWIDLYVGSLYLPKKSNNTAEILSPKTPKAVKLNIVSGMISSSKMIAALNEGMEKSTNGNTAQFKDEMAKLISFFKEEISKGDDFTLVFVPGTGIVAFKNGVKKGVVEGDDFQKAFFGIWLSNNPVDKDLKKDMLGK
ncbi:chalcone isomerase family protein [Flavobacterium sp.]|uniref:chalcone isomerase family protein n=1 Tax=Flavobacterium sp. TaxID=239 RepID=UPI003529CD5B